VALIVRECVAPVLVGMFWLRAQEKQDLNFQLKKKTI
jgi:hypothetical protein